MKEFRSLEEVERASLRSPLRSELRLGKPSTAHRAVHGTLKRLIDAYGACGEEYVPEDDGHVVLVEEQATDDDVRAAIGYALRDAPLEGCVRSAVAFTKSFFAMMPAAGHSAQTRGISCSAHRIRIFT